MRFIGQVIVAALAALALSPAASATALAPATQAASLAAKASEPTGMGAGSHAGGARSIEFGGEEVRVPAGWRVIRLDEHLRACVRLDRRVVYLGRPSASQRCPAHAAGRERAIVVTGREDRAGGPGATASLTPVSPVAGPSVYTGLGFDACTAPSPRSMRAWKASSPYEAIGVYIGGLNRACSQPNLTSTWVGEQVAAGWHLIPTYVGLQATTSSCTSCAKLSSSTATFQGTAAADDAVADAAAIGIGPGSPIYYDMESYTRTSTATSSTLTFLSAWTKQLHALGYASGVYSSSASGIADLAKAIGTTYTLPDHIWMANWNGRQSTDDSYVPDTAWSLQQRIHQYRGGHDETWGGVTINIDNNYLDGGTVGLPTAELTLPPLTVSKVRPEGGTVSVTVRCGWEASLACPGRILLRSHVRVPLRGRASGSKVVRVGVASRLFRLRGGNTHTFRVALNERGRPLLVRRSRLRTQLLVAIPGSRATRAVVLSRLR